MTMHFSTTRMGTLMIAGLVAACSGVSGSTEAGGTSSIGTGGGGANGGAAQGGGPVGGGPSGGASNPSTGIGGAPIGGASTGLATGGALTGGASNGGSSAQTGGKSSGGSSAQTGGKSSGGASSATGGASNGGNTSSSCSLTSVTTGAGMAKTITVGSAQRSYLISVPADAAGTALPLVFVWDGVSRTAQNAYSMDFKGIETNHHAIFVYPDSNNTNGWDYNKTGPDVAFFDALMTEVTSNYCIDMNRVFAIGMSAGGIMSNALGCFRGNVLRAIAPSSAMYWNNTCTGDVAVMVICGTQDTFNACDDASNGALSETNVWAPKNGCTTQTVTSTTYSGCSEFQGCRATDPLLLCVHSGGHGWPTAGNEWAWSFFMSL